MQKEPITSPKKAEEIAQAVHSLRNGMNSLLMNAAVLGRRSDDFPESLRPFVERIKQSGQLCSDQLAHLFALIDARGKK
jgi:signal transduction histidine kinase